MTTDNPNARASGNGNAATGAKRNAAKRTASHPNGSKPNGSKPNGSKQSGKKPNRNTGGSHPRRSNGFRDQYDGEASAPIASYTTRPRYVVLSFSSDEATTVADALAVTLGDDPIVAYVRSKLVWTERHNLPLTAKAAPSNTAMTTPSNTTTAGADKPARRRRRR